MKGLHKITPSFLKGCKIFWRECEGLHPKIRVIALQFYSLLFRISTPQSPTFSFDRICTHTQTITISNNLCAPMLTHSMTCAHPMFFKLRLCIQKLCNVCYLPTPSLGWIGQIKGRSLSLASTQSASWLAYSLHPRSLTPIWSWMQGCTNPMPTHAHPWTITLHPCPPKTHEHGHPM